MASTREHRQSRTTGWVRSLSSTPSMASLRFARSNDDVLIGGVASGLAHRWGVEPVLVRIAFGILSWAGAIGVIAYLVAWSISLDPGDRRAPPPRKITVGQSIAFGCLVLGIVTLLRTAGLWLGDAVGIPLVIGGIGAAVVYVGTGADRRFRGMNRPASAT
ncbi:MAG: PspC domain-containing protein, partial [Actinomycetota bacterium]